MTFLKSPEVLSFHGYRNQTYPIIVTYSPYNLSILDTAYIECPNISMRELR